MSWKKTQRMTCTAASTMLPTPATMPHVLMPVHSRPSLLRAIVCVVRHVRHDTHDTHDTTRAGGKAVHEEESAAAIVGGQEEEPTEDLDPDPVEGEARAHDNEHARPAHPRPSEIYNFQIFMK